MEMLDFYAVLEGHLEMDLFTISESRGPNGKLARNAIGSYLDKSFGWQDGKHEGKTFQQSIDSCFRRSDMTKDFRKKFGKKKK